MTRIPLLKAALLLLFTLGIAAQLHADVLIKPGEKIAFLGDSITHLGRGEKGWCTLVVGGLKTAGIPVEQVNAGHGGNTSRDMLARIDQDVIAQKPTWMTLLCGTNDNPNHGLPLEESKKSIMEMVEKAQAAGIKVLLITRPVRFEAVGENDYHRFVVTYGKEKGIPVADSFEAMKRVLAQYRPQNSALPKGTVPLLTVPDGTHLNDWGNQIIAECVLEALGLGPEQIAKIKATWPAIAQPTADQAAK